MTHSVDYKRLGEVSGKAWRLGHTGAGDRECIKEIDAALHRMNVPRPEYKTFRLGFWSGIGAVDKERGKAKK